MRDIQTLRAELDQIDAEIVALLERRLSVSREVAEYKRERQLPILDASREEQVLEDRAARLDEENLREYVREVFRDIMAMSRAEQTSRMEENHV